ncbi:ABC transporter permease [Halovivax limisalsi]|uniref:ABC transporter permease n=1 Tax=Halovivax limisalsi TaxID=1453760 RepID=UPI001FFD8904|nr:ABC transporter permease [Halovivax limisalsi]
MSFTSYLARRLGQNVLVIVALSTFIFFIARILPGDPVRVALGQHASEEQVQEMRREMGLNEPLYVQFFDWASGMLQGDWGTALRTGNQVSQDIIVRLPATLELVIVAMTFAVVLAIPFGMISGINKDRWQDHVSRITTLTGISMPRFWVAILLQVVFVAWLGLFPLTGRISPNLEAPPTITGLYLIDSLVTGRWATFVDVAHHIVLPGFALGLATLAQVTRLIRSEIIEQQRKDYILAANAWGMPANLIHYKYMLKNAFTSSLTILGLSFGFILGNAFLIEIIFSWPGFARYGVDALLFQDFNAIVGVVIVVGIAFVTANLVVDILYGYLDPRVRYGGD